MHRSNAPGHRGAVPMLRVATSVLGAQQGENAQREDRGGTAGSTLTRRAFAKAKHTIVSCETNRNRSVIALADMSTIIRLSPVGA